MSVYGVFVVETKNYKGWIFGGENQKQWTQRIYKHSLKFQNPLHQNYKHTKTLQSLLGLNDEQIHSVIVFVGDSTFKTDMPANVTHGGGYIRHIKSLKKVVLDGRRIPEIINQIEAEKLVQSLKTDYDHKKHVSQIVRDNVSSVSCPRCGSDMQIREAKKGKRIGQKFWGCVKFPQCKGTVQVGS